MISGDGASDTPVLIATAWVDVTHAGAHQIVIAIGRIIRLTAGTVVHGAVAAITHAIDARLVTITETVAADPLGHRCTSTAGVLCVIDAPDIPLNQAADGIVLADAGGNLTIFAASACLGSATIPGADAAVLLAEPTGLRRATHAIST